MHSNMEETKELDYGTLALESLTDIDNSARLAFKKMSKYFGQKILEVGSGIGNNIQFYPKDREVYFSDYSEPYVKLLKEKHPGINTLLLDIQKKPEKEWYRNYFQTIVCFNVLEHVKDDKGAIDNMHDILTDDGTLILLVPANQSLYSKFDKNVGHYRRYSEERLMELLKDKFETEIIHFNTLGYFGWLYYCKWKQMEILPKSQLKIYDKMTFLNTLLDKFSPFFLSYIVICKKKNEKK